MRVTGGPEGADPLSGLIWVRILPFELRGRGWQLRDENGEDVLDMIRALRPDVLERFITGIPNQDAGIPMGPGRPPMAFDDYLDAAMASEAPGGFLTPKVHLNDIWSDGYRMEAAQDLLDLPVTPRLRYLSLDQYFTHGSPDDHRRVLQDFLAMGWRGLGFNFAGGPKPVFGLAAYAMAGVNAHTWNVNPDALAAMQREGIRIRLVHIDYPQGIRAFAALTPDRQADVIQTLAGEQCRLGFSLVYPVLYGRAGYDAASEVTRRDGPYGGETVFELIRKDIRDDRLHLASCRARLPGAAAAD